MKLNHREYPSWREGLTVQDVITENSFTWPKLVVKVNGRVIWPEEYEKTGLREEDDLEVIHLLRLTHKHLYALGKAVPVFLHIIGKLISDGGLVKAL